MTDGTGPVGAVSEDAMAISPMPATDAAAPAPPREGDLGPVDPDVLAAVSFDALFADHHSRMVRLATLLVDDSARAEELVQDAFVRVHRRWGRVREPAAYLRAAVVNACRNELRRRRVERAYAERFGRSAGVAAETSDPLVDALRVLSPRRRAAVVLRFYEDLSEAEIARALGCRPGTVKSMLHRSLTQLREVIER